MYMAFRGLHFKPVHYILMDTNGSLEKMAWKHVIERGILDIYTLHSTYLCLSMHPCMIALSWQYKCQELTVEATDAQGCKNPTHGY